MCPRSRSARIVGDAGGRRLRLIVLEDEPLFRDLLVAVLAQQPQLEVVGDFATAADALAAAPALQPDVALLDIELGGGGNGIAVGMELRRMKPEIGILLLSNHGDAELLAGVTLDHLAGWSYLLKRSVADASALIRAIEGAASGLVVLDPELIRRRRNRLHGPLTRLTRRQVEILELIAEGYTNVGIGEQLGLAQKSVENQINGLYQALGIDRGDGSVHVRVRAALTFLGRDDG